MPILGNLLQRMAAEPPPDDAIHVDEQDHYNDEWKPPFDLRDVVRIRTNQKFTDHYTLYEEIGEGKFGKVFRCVEKDTNLELAAKSIRLKKDADLAKVEKEINIMTQMRHRCIAQIYDSFQISATEIVLIMEFVSGGELFDRVVDNYILTETAVAMIMYQICEAIRYIHSQKIIHLDLKPENIMCVSLTGNQIKLIDFGLAQYYDGQHDLLFMAGTPEFAAPEVIKYEPLDFHTDMWSLGVIAYILLSGQSPFLGDNIALTYCNVEKGRWSFCEEFDENGISDEARDFITKLLIVDKNKRMLPDDCLQHPWITNSLDRARSKSIEERPLNTGKLRSYVRNKRFRRLVFGVLFINSVTRMFSTLQAKKSEHGIQYVKNMLNATVENGGTNAAQSLVKSAFAKRRRNATGEEETNKHALSTNVTANEQPSTSQEGNELHRKPKRSNNNRVTETNDETAASNLLAAAKRAEFAATEIAEQQADTNRNVLEVPARSEASSPEASRTASPARIKRQRDKAGRPKSSGSRKASSSEQAAKKPKQGSSGTLKVEAPAEEPPKSESPKPAQEPPKESTKVGGLLAKFQQQQTDQQPFTLPVASFVPIKKPVEPESSVTVTLLQPEDGQKPSLKIAEEEKPTKVKKLRKVSTKKAKSNSTSIDLKPATIEPSKIETMKREVHKDEATKSEVRPELSKIAAAKKELEKKMDRKSADSLPDPKKPGNSKPRSSVVNALLQRLEQNDAPPMVMAVSSFVPTPKVETAIETKPKSKVLRIEPIETENKNEKPKGTTSVQVLNLEKKVVSERKTKVKQKDRTKQVASGDSTRTKTEQEKQSTCELSLHQKTTTKEAGSETKVEREKVKLANSVTTKEKETTKVAGAESKHRVAEKTLESVASIDLQKSTREGRKLKKKQLAISEEETTKAGIDVLSAAKHQLKRVNGTAENKLLQRATAIDDGEKASVHFKSQKSLVFSSDANGSIKVDHQLRLSIDDESLLQAQQDAFDFSLLRSKLESRLTGRHDSEDSVYNENCKLKEQNLAEIRSRLSDTGNIKRAMNKWQTMEKETAQHK